ARGRRADRRAGRARRLPVRRHRHRLPPGPGLAGARAAARPAGLAQPAVRRRISASTALTTARMTTDFVGITFGNALPWTFRHHTMPKTPATRPRKPPKPLSSTAQPTMPSRPTPKVSSTAVTNVLTSAPVLLG